MSLPPVWRPIIEWGVLTMLESPLRIVGRFPRPVRLLLVGTLVNKLGTFIIPYLTLVLLRDFHMREGEAARLLFAYGAGSVVSILAGGVITDRFGRRRTLLVSLFGSGVLAVAMGLVPSADLFVPLLVAFGFIADLYRPAASAIIGDLLPSSERASGFAGLRMAVNLGWASGTAIGGLLADWDWRLLFLGDGLTTLAYGVLVYFAIPETRSVGVALSVAPDSLAQPAGTKPARPVPGRGPTNPLRDGVFLATTANGLLFTLMFCSHLTILPLTVTQSAGYPAVVFGLLAAVNGVLVAFFEISITERLKPFRRLRLAALGCFVSAVGFGMIGLVMHWAWFLLTVFVFTAGEILASPQQIAFVADWAPPEARGRYLSLYQATWSVAFAVNPAITLPLHAALGERAFWGLMPIVALPGVFVLLRLDRTADRPERLRGVWGGGMPPQNP
ncbi:MAG TPA: MFS transporter [Vicinamibacteria bacterium]|nr:MFS transporter [Vicinamibacteria bacterium]